VLFSKSRRSQRRTTLKMVKTTPSLSEFIWEYVKTHDFCSRAVITGKYIDTFGIETKRVIGEGKSNREKTLLRAVASMFTVMKNLGIVSRFSVKTVRVNRVVFNAFSLQDVLNHKRGDCVSKRSISIDII